MIKVKEIMDIWQKMYEGSSFVPIQEVSDSLLLGTLYTAVEAEDRPNLLSFLWKDLWCFPSVMLKELPFSAVMKSVDRLAELSFGVSISSGPSGMPWGLSRISNGTPS